MDKAAEKLSDCRIRETSQGVVYRVEGREYLVERALLPEIQEVEDILIFGIRQ